MDEFAAVGLPVKKAVLPNPFRRMADNPVILKELRGRMRGRRAFVILTIYLVLISLLIGVVYAYQSTQGNTVYWNPGFRQNIGKIIFGSVVLFEFLLIGFIGPALTAGAITSERERQTFDLLRTTLVSESTLVLGKLGSACIYLFLLILTALPIEALAFLLGGVGVEEILISSLMLVVNIIFFCALGLLCSSFTKRTLTATITSYTVILLSLLVPGLIVYGLGAYISANINLANSGKTDLLVIPLTLLMLVLSTNPFTAALVSEMFLIQDQTLFLVKIPTLNGLMNPIYLLSPWILDVALCVILSVMMIFVSILFVRRPDR